MSPTLRQDQITNFENLIEEIQEEEKMNMIPCCVLIFFYENDEELSKNADLKIKYPNNIFYVKTIMKKLDLKKIETENQLTNIINLYKKYGTTTRACN
jgi:transcription initiation factor TFIIIB Brf1 subunit/transcription initiation factor TFIIB